MCIIIIYKGYIETCGVDVCVSLLYTQETCGVDVCVSLLYTKRHVGLMCVYQKSKKMGLTVASSVTCETAALRKNVTFNSLHRDLYILARTGLMSTIITVHYKHSLFQFFPFHLILDTIHIQCHTRQTQTPIYNHYRQKHGSSLIHNAIAGEN